MVNEQKNEIKKEKWISQRKTLIYTHMYINTHPRTRKHIYYIYTYAHIHIIYYSSQIALFGVFEIFKLFVFLIESGKLFHTE